MNVEKNEIWFTTSDVKADIGKYARVSYIAVSISQFGSVGIRLGGAIILARVLSPEDFGLVAMAAPLVAVLGLLRELGLT